MELMHFLLAILVSIGLISGVVSMGTNTDLRNQAYCGLNGCEEEPAVVVPSPVSTNCDPGKIDKTGACNPACCNSDSQCNGQKCTIANGYCKSGFSCNPSTNQTGTPGQGSSASQLCSNSSPTAAGCLNKPPGTRVSYSSGICECQFTSGNACACVPIAGVSTCGSSSGVCAGRTVGSQCEGAGTCKVLGGTTTGEARCHCEKPIVEPPKTVQTHLLPPTPPRASPVISPIVAAIPSPIVTVPFCSDAQKAKCSSVNRDCVPNVRGGVCIPRKEQPYIVPSPSPSPSPVAPPKVPTCSYSMIIKCWAANAICAKDLNGGHCIPKIVTPVIQPHCLASTTNYCRSKNMVCVPSTTGGNCQAEYCSRSKQSECSTIGQNCKPSISGGSCIARPGPLCETRGFYCVPTAAATSDRCPSIIVNLSSSCAASYAGSQRCCTIPTNPICPDDSNPACATQFPSGTCSEPGKIECMQGFLTRCTSTSSTSVNLVTKIGDCGSQDNCDAENKTCKQPTNMCERSGFICAPTDSARPFPVAGMDGVCGSGKSCYSNPSQPLQVCPEENKWRCNNGFLQNCLKIRDGLAMWTSQGDCGSDSNCDAGKKSCIQSSGQCERNGYVCRQSVGAFGIDGVVGGYTGVCGSGNVCYSQ